MPLSTNATCTRPGDRDTLTFSVVALACLTALASASEHTKYTAASTAGASRPTETSSSTGHAGPIGEGGKRRRKTTVGQRPRMDALGEVMKLCARDAELAHDPGHIRRCLQLCGPGCRKQVCDALQTRFRASVQLPLQTPPVRLSGLDDPPPRYGELAHSRPHLRLEARIRDRHPAYRSDGLDECRVMAHRFVVDEDGDRASSVHYRRDRSFASRFGKLDTTTGVVDIVFLLG